jgi:hypothetical protein
MFDSENEQEPTMTNASTRTILYTTPNCSGCDRARARLIAEGENFEERKRHVPEHAGKRPIRSS